ncbi:MAG TPA: BlaI/MecI/CopY family transcriptional regulator [Gemmatimonadaceae bacterium]
MPRKLSRRTQQVLDVLYRRGEASAAEVMEDVPDLPSYSAARSVLRALEARGLVRHREKDLRYVYSPVVPRRKASRSALVELIDTFFGGEPEPALQSLVDLVRDGRYDLDFKRAQEMIERARREGR